MIEQSWGTRIWSSGLVGMLALAGAVLAESPNTHVVHEMAALYDISEEAATDRLASEIVAASQYQLIRELNLKGYAGSWYDPDSARLVVATTRISDRQLLSFMNIESILVHHDLLSLQELAEHLADEFPPLSDYLSPPLK